MAPTYGCIKLNVDAAVNTRFSFLAVVARDDQGEFLKAWAKEVNIEDPLVSETSTIWWALELAKTAGYQKYIYMSNVVQAWAKDSFRPPPQMSWETALAGWLGAARSVLFSVDQRLNSPILKLSTKLIGFCISGLDWFRLRHFTTLFITLFKAIPMIQYILQPFL